MGASVGMDPAEALPIPWSTPVVIHAHDSSLVMDRWSGCEELLPVWWPPRPLLALGINYGAAHGLGIYA